MHIVLCRILKKMLRSEPSTGIGKSEALKHKLSNLWSHHLTQKDRLIYIFTIGEHYSDT